MSVEVALGYAEDTVLSLCCPHSNTRKEDPLAELMLCPPLPSPGCSASSHACEVHCASLPAWESLPTHPIW